MFRSALKWTNVKEMYEWCAFPYSKPHNNRELIIFSALKPFYG